MSEQRIYSLDVSTLSPYILKPKQIYEDIDFARFERSGGYKSYLLWRSAYIYSENDIADNLFLEIECRKYPNYTYHSFKLLLKHKKHVNIIYQIEIYPDFELSHRGKKGEEIYGSHVHNLYNTYKVTDMQYDAKWYDWLNYFCENANIKITGTHREPIISDSLDL